MGKPKKQVQMTRAEFCARLEEHALWQSSAGGEGARFDVSAPGITLSGLDLVQLSGRGADMVRKGVHTGRTSPASPNAATPLNLSGANFAGADMRAITARGCRFDGADFSGANLNMATLCWSSFERCTLDGASLEYSDLRGSIFSYATLRGASLCYAALSQSRISICDLPSEPLKLKGTCLDPIAHAKMAEALAVAGVESLTAYIGPFRARDVRDGVIEAGKQYAAPWYSNDLASRFHPGFSWHVDLEAVERLSSIGSIFEISVPPGEYVIFPDGTGRSRSYLAVKEVRS